MTYIAYILNCISYISYLQNNAFKFSLIGVLTTVDFTSQSVNISESQLHTHMASCVPVAGIVYKFTPILTHTSIKGNIWLPARGPLTCCMLPRIFCPSRWMSLVTTWGYLLLMEFRAPSGSLASSESLTAWTVVARFMWVRASTWMIHKTAFII